MEDLDLRRSDQALNLRRLRRQSARLYRDFDRGYEFDTDDHYAGPCSLAFLEQLATDVQSSCKDYLFSKDLKPPFEHIGNHVPSFFKDSFMMICCQLRLAAVLKQIKRLRKFPELFESDDVENRFLGDVENWLQVLYDQDSDNALQEIQVEDEVEELIDYCNEKIFPGYDGWFMKGWDQFLEDGSASVPMEIQPEDLGDTKTLQIIPEPGLDILDEWKWDHDQCLQALNLPEPTVRAEHELFTRLEEYFVVGEYDTDDHLFHFGLLQPAPLDYATNDLDDMHPDHDEDIEEDVEDREFWLLGIRQAKCTESS